jgi:hypothetical protein
LASAIGFVLEGLFLDHRVLPITPSAFECAIVSLRSASTQGVPIALAQWFVLRRFSCGVMLSVPGHVPSQMKRSAVQETYRWIVLTIAGFVLGGILSGLAIWLEILIDVSGGYISEFHRSLDAGEEAFVGALLFGTTLGYAQWLLTRYWAPKNNKVWIAATLGGSLLGSIVQWLYWWFIAFTPNTSPLIPFVQWRAQSATIVVNILILSAFQSLALKRLASEWIPRMRAGS